jgi:AcrR family transcriptional regulator
MQVKQPILGRRDRRKIEFHTGITTCALAMFRTRGYGATTVDDICHEIGISKATFFRYFPSKDAVLRDHLTSVMNSIEVATLAEDSRSDKSLSVSQLRDVFRRLEDSCISEPEIARALIDSGVLDPTRNPDPQKRFDPSYSVVGRILLRGQDRGEIDAARRIDALALMFNACAYSVIGWWVGVGRESGEQPGLVAAVEAILQGVGSSI